MRFDDNQKLIKRIRELNNTDAIVNLLCDISTSLAIIADSSELGKLIIEMDLEQKGDA